MIFIIYTSMQICGSSSLFIIPTVATLTVIVPFSVFHGRLWSISPLPSRLDWTQQDSECNNTQHPAYDWHRQPQLLVGCMVCHFWVRVCRPSSTMSSLLPSSSQNETGPCTSQCPPERLSYDDSLEQPAWPTKWNFF